MSPPTSLKFLNLSSAKRARLSDTTSRTDSSSNTNVSSLQVLLDLLAARESPTRFTREQSSESSVSSPPNDSNIEGYIDFLGIRDREHTLDILLTNGFHTYKVFKSRGLARSDVKALGLTLGVVTMLFDNVAKYERALASGLN